MPDLDARLASVTPSPRQLSLQRLEFYAFAHFTVNTFTGLEWGDGSEDPRIFDPHALDASQWVSAIKSAGMKGLILTCKHHDGFCLWPSRYTRHSVASSPYKGGRGDVVREVSDACREGGIKFGVYLSPWDRNNPCYGSGREYDDYFVAQLTELLTGYGDIFAVWFDGACGEGKSGRKQPYDWPRYYETVRRLQPGACMNVCGPDVRWCGNEAASTRDSEWSVVPLRMRDTEKIAADSQQSDDPGFRLRKITASDADLGSRRALRDEPDLVWYPAEVDTSIRPGWFYHPEEDDKVKGPEELFDIYLRSVGGNATLLLNIPPTKSGLLHPNDVNSLKALGERITAAFAHNLAEGAELSATASAPGHSIDLARKDSYNGHFRAPGPSCTITLSFPRETLVSYVVLKEHIPDSQRIERFRILSGGEELFSGTTVGYKRIVRLRQPVKTRQLEISIDDSRCYPTLSFLGVY